jgi:hypothetical protein
MSEDQSWEELASEAVEAHGVSVFNIDKKVYAKKEGGEPLLVCECVSVAYAEIIVAKVNVYDVLINGSFEDV